MSHTGPFELRERKVGSVQTAQNDPLAEAQRVDDESDTVNRWFEGYRGAADETIETGGAGVGQLAVPPCVPVDDASMASIPSLLERQAPLGRGNPTRPKEKVPAWIQHQSCIPTAPPWRADRSAPGNGFSMKEGCHLRVPGEDYRMQPGRAHLLSGEALGEHPILGGEPLVQAAPATAGAALCLPGEEHVERGDARPAEDHRRQAPFEMRAAAERAAQDFQGRERRARVVADLHQDAQSFRRTAEAHAGRGKRKTATPASLVEGRPYARVSIIQFSARTLGGAVELENLILGCITLYLTSQEGSVTPRITPNELSMFRDAGSHH